MSCTGPVKDALGPTVPSGPSLVSEWNDEEFHEEPLVWSILQASAAICNPWSLYLLFLVPLTKLVLPFLSLAAGLSETASHPTSADKAQGILLLPAYRMLPSRSSSFQQNVHFTQGNKGGLEVQATCSLSGCANPSYSGCWVSLSTRGVPAQGSPCHPARLGGAGSCSLCLREQTHLI